MPALSICRSFSVLTWTLVAPLCAQTVLHVGPGQTHTTIAAAVAAAAPGDVLAVHAGTYSGLTIDKGLLIRAEPTGAAVYVASTTSFLVPSTVHSRICGIDFERIHIGIGVESFEDCDAESVSILGGAATFQRCRIQNGVPAVYINAGEASFVQCEVRGGGTGFYNASTSAVYAWGSAKVHASNSVFAAGFGYGLATGWPGIWAVQNNEIDLVDCEVTGGDYLQPNAQPGGAALIANSNATIRHHRCTLTSGVGTIGSQPPTMGPVTHTPLLGASMQEQGLFLAGSLHADFAGEPGDLVVVLAAFGLNAPTPAPLVAPLQWGFDANGAVVSWLPADVAGRATYGFSIPSDPAFRDLGVWLTGAAFAGLPARLSPPIGGVIR